MELIKCLVIDDDEIDRLLIKEYVLSYPALKLVDTYSNALESLERMQTQDIDLLFLDVDMPMINGVDFLKKLDNPPLCIFITSYVEFALD